MSKFEIGKEYKSSAGVVYRIMADSISGANWIAQCSPLSSPGHKIDLAFFNKKSGDRLGATNETLLPTVEHVKCWVNVYNMQPYIYSAYLTKQEADKNAARNRIACIYIDVKEGQGIDAPC